MSYSSIKLSWYQKKSKFTGNCLEEPNASHTHGKRVNNYIAYELGASSSHNNDRTLKNCLFGAVTLAKNADIDKYGCSGDGIGFDKRWSFSFPGGGFGQIVLTFVVDMRSSADLDNKKKDILVLGKGAPQGLEHTLTAEKMYSTNFTVTKKKGCVTMEQAVICLWIVQKFTNLKQKILQL